MRGLQGWSLRCLFAARCRRLEKQPRFGYIEVKFLVVMAKSGSFRSRSFLFPAMHPRVIPPRRKTARDLQGGTLGIMTDESLEDDRIIRETGIDARIAALIAPPARAAGYRLVRVRLSGQNGLTLQVMAERDDGTMTVEDCEALSRAISPVLDVEDPIDKAYHLEVSSAGIDRPLVRKSDFDDALGHLVKMETAIMVAERKRFRGRITEVDDEGVTIDRDQASYGDAPTVRVPFDAIAEARLILTDELIRDALKKDKLARKGLLEDEDEDSEPAAQATDN